MGAIPRTRWRSAIRSVLLALLTALAWLAWGAGTATASSLVPDGGELGNLSESVLTQPLPAPPVVVSAGDTAVAGAGSLTDSATGAVNTLAAPVVPVVAGTTATVTGLVPRLPDLPLVQAPLPLPLPDILPLPDQLPPLLPEPLPAPLPLPLPLPDLLPVPVPPQLPGLPPLTTPAPGSGATPAANLPSSDAVAQVAAGAGLTPASTATAPAEETDVTAQSNTLRFGFTAAQDFAGSATRRAATANPSGPGDGTGNTGRLDPPALANGAATAGSGSAGGSSSPADLGGSWHVLRPLAYGPHLSGTQTLPAAPSFDPGSSPD
ncbi:hypothetical protein M1E17_06230 [Arthrobacter sp. D1-29]